MRGGGKRHSGGRGSRTTIAKAFKNAGITREKGQRIGRSQGEEVRIAWQAFASQGKAEPLAVIDEALFRLRTMWRSIAYAPTGGPGR